MHCNEILGSLADRKLIATELTEKMPLLLDLLNNEMDQAKEIFDQQEVFFKSYIPTYFFLCQARVKGTGKALMDRNMPPVAGQLNFSQEMRLRYQMLILSFTLLFPVRL